MKLTAAEIKRLMALMAKAATDLSSEEKIELKSLQDKAAAAKDDDSGDMTADEVKKTVESAVKAALPAGSTVTPDQVKTIVSEAVKGLGSEKIDLADLASKVKAAMPTTISADDVKGIIDTALKGIRRDSKMQHQDDSNGGLDSSIEFPIAHRSGNLAVDAKQVLNVMMKGPDFINDGIPDSVLKDAERRGEANEKRLVNRIKSGGVHAVKALTTTGAGTGAEFMNSTISSTLLARMYLTSNLAAALAASEVQMPSNPFTYPLSTTRPKFGTGSENANSGVSDPGSAALILNAKKLIGQVEYSYEAEEDAVIAILPNIISQLGDAAADALEDALINGDTTATHQDSDTQTDPVAAARVFMGIRKLTLAQANLKLSLATGGLSTANIIALKKLLGRWGLVPKDLLIVAGVNGYNDLIGLPETLTAEKAGDKTTARILTGMAPNLLGMDIIATARIREDLNAAGVYDGTTTTKGSFLIIHKPSWIGGVRRGFTLEQDKDVRNQKKWIVASFRRAFAPLESLANTKAAVIGFNYTA